MVHVEDHGEVSMGASRVEFVVPRPVDGVARFYTVNGRAFWAGGNGFLYLHDAFVILRWHPGTGRTAHHRVPSGWFLSRARADKNALTLFLYSERGENKTERLPYRKDVFLPGTGLPSTGLFPTGRAEWLRRAGKTS